MLLTSRVAAVFLALATTVFCTVARAAVISLSGHVPEAAKRLTPAGRFAGTNRLDLAIGLPLRDQGGLNSFIRDLYNPASPSFHQFLTPDQFTVRFGPTKQDYDAVLEFARTNGLVVTHTHGNRLLVDVRGSVAEIEKAFHLSLRKFHHPTEAREFFAPDTEPSVDTRVPIQFISGLNDYWKLRPRLWRENNLPNLPAGMAPRSGSGLNGSYVGDDFRNAYVPGTALSGAGQMVGLLQFDGYYTNDIATYATLAGGGRTNIIVETVLIDGANGTPSGANTSNGEVSLDIEMAMSMAPGLAKIVVYEAPNSSAFFDDVLSAMAANYLVKNLSCSWGGGGPDPTAETIFQQMAAQGQTFFNASGDSDAFTGLVPFPSDSPNITEVGGTTLTMNGLGESYASEIVWNWGDVTGQGNYMGSSGGISTTYTIPSWQQSVSMSANNGSTTMRNTPDVALTGDNVRVYYGNGTSDVFGGTSCAAPLWAGFMALVNQQAAAIGCAPIGFVNPALYAVGTGTNYPACFNDITSGNNFWSGSPTNFPATNGYDLCTGWGTPAGTNLINALVGMADNLGISPAAGFVFASTNYGPFDVTSQTFRLTNSGAGAFDWQMGGLPAWLSIQPTNGSLPPGGGTNVVVSLNSVATNLPPGVYLANLAFTNLATSVVQFRPVDLVIILPSLVQNGGFETGDFTGWTLNGNTVSGNYIYNAVENPSGPEHFDVAHSGNYGAFLGDTQPAFLSESLSTVPGQIYLFSFWLNNPISGQVQRFSAAWNTNQAATNVLWSVLNPPVLDWTNLNFLVTATDSNTVIQFEAENDPNYFGLDDVSVVAVPPPWFSTVSLTANVCCLTCRALPNVSYALQYTTNLAQPDWEMIGSSVIATGSMLTFFDTNGPNTDPQRFYRITVSP